MNSMRRLFTRSNLNLMEGRPAGPAAAPDLPRLVFSGGPSRARAAAAPQRARGWSYQVLQTAIGMGVFQVVTFLTGILVARGLGPRQQGRFQLVLSIVIFTATLAKMGLDEAVAYLIPKYEALKPDRVSALVAYSLGVAFSISLALGGLFYLASAYVERYLFRLEGLAADLKFAAWLIPATMLLMMSMSVLRGLGRSHERAYIYYYIVALAFLACVSVFSISGLTTAGAFIARTASYGLGAVIALALISRAVRPGELRLNRKEISEMHTFAGLLVFAGLFQYVVEQPLVDLVIVGSVASAHDVGVYSVAARVAALVLIAANALTVVLAPSLASSVSNGDSAKLVSQYVRASEWMARLSLFTGMGLILMRKEVLGLFGSEYRTGEWLLVIFLAGQMIVGLSGLNSPLLLASGNARTEFVLTGIFAAAMIAGGVLMGRYMGATGVAFATALSAVMLAIARRIACARLFEARLEEKTRGILLIGLVAGAAGIVVQMTVRGNGITGTVAAMVVSTSVFWLLSMKPVLQFDRVRIIMKRDE